MTTRHRLHITRDLVLFAVGLAGIIYETLAGPGDREALLIVFSGMCGLPVFLRLDGKGVAYHRKDSDDE